MPCTSHNELTNIKLAFFPANCTSELQSLDLGIIRSFKFIYKINLGNKALGLLDRNVDPSTLKLNVLDALHFIANSWHEVKPSTIINRFKKSGLCPPDSVEVTEIDDSIISGWGQINCDVSWEAYVDDDRSVSTFEVLTVDDLTDPDTLSDKDVVVEVITHQEVSSSIEK